MRDEGFIFAKASIFAVVLLDRLPDRWAGKRGDLVILEGGFLDVEEGAGEVVEDAELEAVYGGGPEGFGGEEVWELEAREWGWGAARFRFRGRGGR